MILKEVMPLIQDLDFWGNCFISKKVPQNTTVNLWENLQSIESSTPSAKEKLYWLRLYKLFPVCGE